MGIESINRVAAHNIQSSVAARPVSESSEVSDAAAQELSSASMQQAVSVQKASDTERIVVQVQMAENRIQMLR